MKTRLNSIFILLVLSNMIIPSNPELNSSSAKNTIIEMASGYILARSIHTAAKIKVADLLIDGPQDIDTLADRTNCNKHSLYRLLQLLASYNIFHQNEDNYFSITPLAEQLISTNPHSLWPWIVYHHDNYRWNAYADMEYCVKTGTPSFEHQQGKNYFDFISEHPENANHFNEGMNNISSEENSSIINSFDFSNYKYIVDIGGGTGSLLTAIINNNNDTNCTLFDLASTNNGLPSYITFEQSTGFFAPIPKNKDLYILKRILHDWNNEECIQILKNCHDAMHTTSRLLIIEGILSEKNIRDFKKDIDLEMMVLFGGKERTEQEFLTLLKSANFELVKIHSTSSMMSIIEAKKNYRS